MPGRNFLFIPGPTTVPRRIQNAMNVEQEDMRAMDLPEFTKPLNELMLLTPINGAEMAMKDLGYPIELGSGVAAAQEYLRSTAKPRIEQ